MTRDQWLRDAQITPRPRLYLTLSGPRHNSHTETPDMPHTNR